MGLFNLLRDAELLSASGAFHALGAVPMRREGTATVWEWFGRELSTNFTPGKAWSSIHNLAPKMGAWKNPGLVAGGMGLVNVGTLGYSVVQGYHQNGLVGAVKAATVNFLVEGALSQYGYTATMAEAGVSTLTSGRSWVGNMFATGSNMNKGLNFVDWNLRSVGGNVAASMASTMFGNHFYTAPMHMIGSYYGAKYGVQHPFMMGGAIATVVGAKLIAKGSYALARGTLRAGYNYAQMHKQIQTSGDMASFSTEAAYTMRARAVAAIQKSVLNSRSALGAEANFLSYNRNYFSRYRQY